MMADDIGALLSSFLLGVFLMIVLMAACSYSRRRQEDDNNRRQEAAAGMAAALLDSVSHPRRNAGGSDDHTSAATTTTVAEAASAVAEEECAICLVQFEDGDWCSVMPGCRHEFHRSCITMWLTANNNTCPLCRGQLEWIAVTHDHDMTVV